MILGCDNKSASTTPDAKSEPNTETPTSAQDSAKQVSLPKETMQQIDSLKAELDQAKENIKKLESNAEQSWKRTIMVNCCVALLTILLTMSFVWWYTIKHLGENGVKHIVNEHLKKYNEKLGLALKENIQSTINATIQQRLNESLAKGYIGNLESRINKLESQLINLDKKVSITPATDCRNQEKSNSVATKRLYANTNSEEYFTDVLDTKQDTSVFTIDLKSQTIGEFDIISIDKIKQRNGWESVIDYKGDCPISEAKKFKTERPGRCEKLPEGIWKVVEKLKITISE